MDEYANVHEEDTSGFPSGPATPLEGQLAFGGVLDDAAHLDAIPAGKRAVIYLRVSTPSQVNTDYDPEGISLPAQRKACYRKADQLGVTIVDEYIEPGKSAREMTKRVAFQQMLERIRVQHDVDYVILYKLSRMARNRLDDAIVAAELKKRGVTLVSATEAIDETPVGQLMHGILAAFNEFRSAEEGADIAYKMGEKAKKGGTLGKAPIGYLNTLDRIDGREVRSVAIDHERAPLIRLAFEMYAGGESTLEDIVAELTDRGLRTRPTQRRPAGPISTSKVHGMLRDPYYKGVVTYQGVEYPGRHEPIIDTDLFERVQKLLQTRGRAGERRRIIHHYLKGTLWCAACFRRHGTFRRMVARRTISRSGDEYFYFFCMGTQDGSCSAKHCNMQRVERAVEEHYKTISLSSEFIDFMRDSVEDAMADQQAAQRALRDQLASQLHGLDSKESNLIELAADGSLAQDKIKARLREIANERLRVKGQLEQVRDDLDQAAAFIRASLQLLDNPYALYINASDEVRRRLNQALFAHILVEQDEVDGADMMEPYGDYLSTQQGFQAARQGRTTGVIKKTTAASFATHYPAKKKGPAQMSGSFSSLSLTASNRSPHRVAFFSKAQLVGLTGFEPATP
ncbi:MAG: recombinase family protein [Actinobacteria bacterium]|nr:recombinase family protein [Actinomycetota bacterium]